MRLPSLRLVLMVALTEPLSHLFEMQGGLGLTLVKEAEATSLPTGAFAVPFSTADVALTAVDEAVDVGTAGGLVGDWPVLEGVDGARVRIRHSPRMGGAFLGRPSVDGAEEPVGVAANLGVSCLAFFVLMVALTEPLSISSKCKDVSG